MTWPTKTDFVDGDVLTAAQVNNIGTNLNLYDPTSATAGQVPIADGAGSVAFGAAAAGALSIMTPTSVTTSTGTATINADGSITLSAASGLGVNGVFTSAKTNYLIHFNTSYNTSGGTDWIRMATGGVADTSNYSYQKLKVNSTTSTASQGSAGSTFPITEPASGPSALCYTSVLVFGPQLASRTGFFSTAWTPASTITFFEAAGIHAVNTSFDGFTMSTGFQHTGTATIYGFDI